jgi:hypothetical protein
MRIIYAFKCLDVVFVQETIVFYVPLLSKLFFVCRICIIICPCIVILFL